MTLARFWMKTDSIDKRISRINNKVQEGNYWKEKEYEKVKDGSRRWEKERKSKKIEKYDIACFCEKMIKKRIIVNFVQGAGNGLKERAEEEELEEFTSNLRTQLEIFVNR